MTDGRRWLALDADMFGKRFTDDLYHKFGWAGIAIWIAFLCACKRSRVPGRMRFINEPDALAQLGVIGWELVDNQGKPWALEDFWTFTGRKKQTRRTSRGRETDVRATHWERWQETYATQRKAEQMRTSRAQKRGSVQPQMWNGDATNVERDSDSDSDTPLPPGGGSEVTSSKKDEQPKDLRVAANAIKAMLGKSGEGNGSTET